jgi:hypothetical protein
MATAGFNAQVLVSGTSTAMTSEATTQVGATSVYYITSEARRVLDPDTAVVVSDGSGVVAASNYTVNYLAGRVTFADAFSVTGSVTVTANYLPLLEVATARGFQFSTSRSLLDATVNGDTAVGRISGLADCSVTLERLDVQNDDLDPGVGTVTLGGLLAAGTWTLVKVYPDSLDTDVVFAAFVRVEADALSATPADLATSSVTFQGVTPGDATQSFWLGNTTT